MLLHSVYQMHAKGAYRLVLDAKDDRQKLKKQCYEIRQTRVTMKKNNKKIRELVAFWDVYKPKLEQIKTLLEIVARSINEISKWDQTITKLEGEKLK